MLQYGLQLSLLSVVLISHPVLVACQCGEPICQVSFCATRNTSLTVGTDRVTFDNTTINDGNAFDLDTSRFTPPQAGLYWIHFSVGMQPYTEVDVRLQGASRTPDIVRPHTSYIDTPTTTSRVDFIQSDGSGSPMWLSSDSALYSDAFLQTSFSGFSLSSAMDPLVAFAVGLSAPIIDTPANIRIAYSTTYLDTHSGWDAVNNEYVVPVAGAYVITGQCGAFPGDNSGMTVYVNGVLQFTVLFNDYTHTGTDFVSYTMILQLIQGDRLYSQTFTGYSIYGDIRHPTSLLGFLYSPYRSVPISWSVTREAYGSITGPVEAYPFDTVYVNQGNGWQASNYRFVAPVSGVYCIHLTAGILLYRGKMELVVKGVTVANVHHESTSSSNNHCTLSRAIILRLEQDDDLRIRVPSNYTLYSDSYKYTSFSGFRIYS